MYSTVYFGSIVFSFFEVKMSRCAKLWRPGAPCAPSDEKCHFTRIKDSFHVARSFFLGSACAARNSRSFSRTPSTGHRACLTTCSATLPKSTCFRPVRPWVEMTITSAGKRVAAPTISAAGEPVVTKDDLAGIFGSFCFHTISFVLRRFVIIRELIFAFPVSGPPAPDKRHGGQPFQRCCPLQRA